MTNLLTSPHLIDLILLLTAAEALVIVLSGRLLPTAVIRTLLPGVFLLVALRAALAEAAWPWVPAALIAALIAHLFDLAGRWRR
jgi:hypothetical protein